MIYWDTSCVLKLYVAESDSYLWQEHAVRSEDKFAASALLDTELTYALEQKEARGEIRSGAARALLKMFRRDVSAGRFVLYPVGSDILARAADIAHDCYHGRKPIHLRTLDGIHLATATRLKCSFMATTDERMRRGAALLKLRVLGK